MSRAREKVVSLENLAEIVDREQKLGRRIALCHGCFDILHAGHLCHLEAARELADLLVITVTPDRFVNKGPNRPVFPEEQRAELLAGLHCVDWVAVNLWDGAVETIRKIRPDLFVKGQEYETRAAEVNPNFLAERVVVEEIGGKVAYTYGFTSSSTAALQKIARASD